ncbi:MAG: hypothetical protein DRJ56_05100 [Thermoprotei archaeon]|nr:MAG: hypothetical protein DRJ56_05100 [Thermoprotei archaeon]
MRAAPLLLMLVVAVSLAHETLSKPPWLRRGTYVEYEIADSAASKEILTVSPETLVALGVLRKYALRYKNCTVVVYTDLDLEEVERRLEEELKGRRLSEHLTLSMYDHVRLHKVISKLAREGKLPLVIEKYYTHYCTTLFEIVDARYYWRCVGFRDGLALVEAGLVGRIRRYDERAGVWRYGSVNYTFTFLLDPDTRRAYTLDGEYLGVVPYWIPSTERSFLLYEMFGIAVNGTIRREGVVDTPLGRVDVYYVWAPATLWTFAFTRAAFDRVTGLLVKTRDYCDPVLKHFVGISGISGEKFVISRVQNVDIPRGYGFQIEERLVVLGLILLCGSLVPVLAKALRGLRPRGREQESPVADYAPS